MRSLRFIVNSCAWTFSLLGGFSSIRTSETYKIIIHKLNKFSNNYEYYLEVYKFLRLVFRAFVEAVVVESQDFFFCLQSKIYLPEPIVLKSHTKLNLHIRPSTSNKTSFTWYTVYSGCAKKRFLIPLILLVAHHLLVGVCYLLRTYWKLQTFISRCFIILMRFSHLVAFVTGNLNNSM